MKRGLFVSALLLFFPSGISPADVLEGCEHRTFQVGQGSCHTVLYSVKKSDDTFYKTLVFCDMGSSSRSAPTKLTFHSTSFSNQIFESKASKKLTKDILKQAPNSTTYKAYKKKSETSSGSSMTADNKEPFDVSKMTKEIEDAVNGVDSFIVMLTHPDKDHINLYTDILGSIQKPILLICGGMWAEHKTDEVAEMRNNIRGKKNVTVIYPSYLDHVDHDALAKEKDDTSLTALFSAEVQLT